MDELLPKLRSFSTNLGVGNALSDQEYDEGIKSQIETVRKISESKLLQNTSKGDSPLDVINPALNTVSYTYILLAHIAAADKGNKNTDPQSLWEWMASFLGSFDHRQIRYLGKELYQITDYVALCARRSRQPGLAIAPIRDALLRLDPSGSVFTNLHLLLVKLALESRAYNAVVPVLDKFILYFPGSISQTKPKFLCDLSLSPTAFITSASGLASTKFKYQELLEYFLYSGMVYIGLRNWESALECLENAVTYPAKDGAVSKIMVEAYKKWIIVGLLLEGKQPSLPKSVGRESLKLYHTLARPYETVAQLFESATASRLKAEVDTGTRIWQDDFNTGLMLHVLAAYQKFQIRNLANIYSKVSIPEVVNQTMSAETGNKLPSAQAAETLIQSMIADGTLNATMSSSPGSPSVLTFKSGGPILSEAQIHTELAGSTERIQTLTQEIKNTDRMLTHDKEYIKYAQKQKKAAKNSQVDQGIAGGEMDWNSMEDEDIMGVY